MSLRLKLNLILGLLLGGFVAVLVAREIDGTRRSVREEIQAANRVATQVLERVAVVYVREGSPSLRIFLERLGRVRANDITLYDATGQVLYRSPPSTYKSGREAPAWFAGLVVPASSRQEIPLIAGRLVIEADASRAVLDGWDDLLVLLGSGGAVFVAANLLVFWSVGRALRPFQAIEQGLESLAGGDWSARLPVPAAREARAIALAFNRMAQAIEENRATERRAVEAEARLDASRELTQAIEHRLEQERGEIARELHDELGQAVTAIRSLAVSITQRASGDADSAQAARLIAETAGRLYDGMHGLIPRLRPLTLDSLDLGDALRDLVEQWRASHPEIGFELALGELLDSAGPTLKLAVYRVVQEAIANAVRHAQASSISIRAGLSEGALAVAVRDDGRGLPQDWERPGRYGLRGMRERVAALGGTFDVSSLPEGGVEVRATIPVEGAP